MSENYVVPNEKLTVFNCNGNYVFEPDFYTIGTFRSAIPDSSIEFLNPLQGDNEHYNNMLTAAAIDLNSWDVSAADTTNGKWYKFIANASSAHIDNGAGEYKIYTRCTGNIGVYVYNFGGTLVASNETGENVTSAMLNYGATYFVCVKSLGSTSTQIYFSVTSRNIGGTTGSQGTVYDKNSMFFSFDSLDALADCRVEKAEITIYQDLGFAENNALHNLGLFQSDQYYFCGPDFTPTALTKLVDYAKMRTVIKDNEEVISYTFDITDIVARKQYDSSAISGFVIKPINENLQANSHIIVYGPKSESYAPTMTVTYEPEGASNNNGYSDTQELGTLGQASVNLLNGKLGLEIEDFSWGGNRMPVTLKHLYNAAIGLNTADFGDMVLGYGFRLNVMQCIKPTEDGGYIYTDEYGNKILLTESDEENIYVSSEEDGELSYNATTRILENGEELLFNADGRLNRIKDQYVNETWMVYDDNGRISMIADSVNRTFVFSYNSSNQLTSISAPDGSQVRYTYSRNALTRIDYPNGKAIGFTYTGGIITAITLYENSTTVHKYVYTCAGSVVEQVTEYGYKNGVSKTGITKTYSISPASRKTVVTTSEDGSSTVYVFDKDHNIINEYILADENSANQVSEDKPITNINNMLAGHNFESLGSYWNYGANNLSTTTFSVETNENAAKFGKTYLRITSTASNTVANGIYQTFSVPSNDYTLSAYVRVVSGFTGANDGVYLRIYDPDADVVVAQSEKLRLTDTEFVRLSASMPDGGIMARVEILVDGAGVAYVNAPQFETNAAANSYNFIANSDFCNSKCWSFDEASRDANEGFSRSGALKIVGDLDSAKCSTQRVKVKGANSTRETYKLSGWAKGNAISNTAGEKPGTPAFRLRAVINFTDGTVNEEPITADFCPHTEDWQYAEIEFSKEKYKAIRDVDIFCDFDYNYGNAFFDDIQLIRTGIETGLTASDFVEETYDDTEDNQESSSNDDNQQSGTTEEETNEFEEYIDIFGNAITETTFTEGESGTIYRSFGYDGEGNNLIRETDPRGNVTQYVVDGSTSRNEQVIDRCGNKTAYEYDQSGRTTKVTSKNANNTELANVSYSYDSLDNVTEIVRGDGLKYMLKYDAFHNLESIGINGKTDGDLIKYTYNTGSNRLKTMTYANGNKMTATYNGKGQMIAEKWHNAAGTLIAHYNYGYDAEDKIVSTIDNLACRMYNYTYNNYMVEQSKESIVTFNSYGLVESKTPVNTIRYYYDNEGKLTKMRIIFSDSEQAINYTTTENGAQVATTTIGQHSFTTSSKTDSFGRQQFDELQTGSAVLSRQFQYLAGEITAEHQQYQKIKSTPTTELVSQITFSDGRTLSYEYDAEERITKVIDSAGGTTEYTYDALGQLLTETVNGTVVNTMTYDNYGNILTKNGITYSYDTVWKDKLISYNGQSITYDKQGNPLTYLGHNLTWEKGRQLKSFGSNTYTYNANGIRTSKTVDGIRHNFELDDGIILRETWGNNTLIPLYDNENSVCGIAYNGVPYYFLKNLQDDIIAITDKDGNTVAKYSYDAWGVPTITQDTSNCQIATVNPFRYRGYYYDSEIGMYYLQSRYYNPVMGRFVNGDDVEYLGRGSNLSAYNLFHYCENEPICRLDPFGNALSYIYGYDQAEAAEINIRSLKKKYNVYSHYVQSNTDFENFWNKKGKKNGKLAKMDVVIINLHGTHQMVQFVNFANLKRRKIDTLVLLSCYGGNYDYFYTNPAYKFFYNNDIRQMVCCDASHDRDVFKNIVRHRVIKTKSMKKYLYLNRETYGFLLYRHSKRKGWLDIKAIGHEFYSINNLLKEIGKW